MRSKQIASSARSDGESHTYPFGRPTTVRNVIRQSEWFAAPAETLFRMYADPTLHGAITGALVTIGATAGSEFIAFNGLLSGTMLAVVEPRLIVQLWRSVAFHPEDPDSTLILTFTSERDGGRVDLVHLDVPDHDLDGVREGWVKHYWTPWRQYLDKR